MKISNPLGVLGEDAACDYLVRKGYKIIERNWRKSHTEIDIIAIQGSTLVFVENGRIEKIEHLENISGF